MPVYAACQAPGDRPDRTIENDPLEEAFLDWIRRPEHTNQRLLTPFQRREYAAFLRAPDRPCRGPIDQNNRTRARAMFCLDDKD